MAEGKRKKFYSEEVRRNFKKEKIEIFIRKEDKEAVRQKAEDMNMSISEYVRYKLLHKMDTDFNPNKLTGDLKDYAKEVNKVGVNINQSTNYLNFLKNQQKVEPKALKDYGVLLRQFKALIEKQKSEIISECRKFRK